MIAKTIKYKDYNGNDREDKFYFNLNKAEITEMELSVNGGFYDRLKSIIEAKDTAEIIKIFKTIILDSYGEKTSDGKRFRKLDDNGNRLSVAFSETEAYSNLFMELANDDKKASEFIIGVMPSDINKEEILAKAEELQKESTTDNQ